jgi:anti-sigma factor RsiW
MNDELYLSARRPDGQDDSDPAIATALSRTNAARAEDLRRTDAAIAAKLSAVQPPAGLRDRILAGARVSQKRSWFDRLGWRSFRNSELLAAAAIVLLLGVAVVLQLTRTGPEARDWRAAATIEVARIESGGGIDHAVREMPSINQWLVAQTCPAPASLPEPVRKLQIFGCSKVLWNNQPMSIVCFNLGEGKEVHLVTIERRHLPGSPPDKALKNFTGPEYASINGYETASWSEGGVAMMLLGKVPRTELEKLLAASAVANTPNAIVDGGRMSLATLDVEGWTLDAHR